MNTQSPKNISNRHVPELALPSWEAYITMLAGGSIMVDDEDRQIVEPPVVTIDLKPVVSQPCYRVVLKSKKNQVAGDGFILDVAGKSQLTFDCGKSVVIGRGKGADVHLEMDIKSSTRHAILEFRQGALVLDDLGSTNGTFLNGTKIVNAEPVSEGDCILVGGTEIRVYSK